MGKTVIRVSEADASRDFKSLLEKVRGGAEVIVVPDAGHAMTEPGIVHELVSATRRLA